MKFNNKELRGRDSSEKQKEIRAIKYVLVKTAAIAAIFAVIFVFVLGVYVCHDNNMHPRVSDGDLAVTLKLGEAYTGDIVVYKHADKYIFGRIVAVAGDVIDISDKGYTVNGVSPGELVYYNTVQNPNSGVLFPYTVKENEVFILNDYRDNQNDSRLWGAVNTEDLKGKVVFAFRRRGF